MECFFLLCNLYTYLVRFFKFVNKLPVAFKVVYCTQIVLYVADCANTHLSGCND